jgi:hypothetical protein
MNPKNSLKTSVKDTKGVKRKLNGLNCEAMKTIPFCSLTFLYPIEKIVSLKESSKERKRPRLGSGAILATTVAGAFASNSTTPRPSTPNSGSSGQVNNPVRPMRKRDEDSESDSNGEREGGGDGGNYTDEQIDTLKDHLSSLKTESDISDFLAQAYLNGIRPEDLGLNIETYDFGNFYKTSDGKLISLDSIQNSILREKNRIESEGSSIIEVGDKEKVSKSVKKPIRNIIVDHNYNKDKSIFTANLKRLEFKDSNRTTLTKRDISTMRSLGKFDVKDYDGISKTFIRIGKDDYTKTPKDSLENLVGPTFKHERTENGKKIIEYRNFLDNGLILSKKTEIDMKDPSKIIEMEELVTASGMKVNGEVKPIEYVGKIPPRVTHFIDPKTKRKVVKESIWDFSGTTYTVENLINGKTKYPPRLDFYSKQIAGDLYDKLHYKGGGLLTLRSSEKNSKLKKTITIKEYNKLKPEERRKYVGNNEKPKNQTNFDISIDNKSAYGLPKDFKVIDVRIYGGGGVGVAIEAPTDNGGKKLSLEVMHLSEVNIEIVTASDAGKLLKKKQEELKLTKDEDKIKILKEEIEDLEKKSIVKAGTWIGRAGDEMGWMDGTHTHFDTKPLRRDKWQEAVNEL